MNNSQMEPRASMTERVGFLTQDFNELVKQANELRNEFAALVPQAETALPVIEAFRSRLDGLRDEIDMLGGRTQSGAVERVEGLVKALEREFDKLKLALYEKHDKVDFI